MENDIKAGKPDIQDSKKAVCDWIMAIYHMGEYGYERVKVVPEMLEVRWEV